VKHAARAGVSHLARDETVLDDLDLVDAVVIDAEPGLRTISE